jgi:hypothetical protein
MGSAGESPAKRSGRRFLFFRSSGSSSGIAAAPVPGSVASEVVPAGQPPVAAPEEKSAAKLKEPFPSERPPGAPVDPWTAFATAPERPPGLILRATRAFFRSLIHEYALVIYAGVLLAVALTWPTLRYPLHTLPQDLGDPARQAWQISWVGHILLTHPEQLWQSNAFYPDTNSFAYGDSLLGYGPIGMLGDGPLAATLRYNVLFVLAHALLAIGGYALVRQLGAGRTGAAVAAVAIAYAPWRLAQEGHLDIISAGGIPLALAMLARGHGWSLRRGLQPKERKAAWAAFGWLLAAWQASLGFSLGLPFLGALGLIVLLLLFGTPLIWLRRRSRRRGYQRHLASAAAGPAADSPLTPGAPANPGLPMSGSASPDPGLATTAQTPATTSPQQSSTGAAPPGAPGAAGQGESGATGQGESGATGQGGPDAEAQSTRGITAQTGLAAAGPTTPDAAAAEGGTAAAGSSVAAPLTPEDATVAGGPVDRGADGRPVILASENPPAVPAVEKSAGQQPGGVKADGETAEEKVGEKSDGETADGKSHDGKADEANGSGDKAVGDKLGDTIVDGEPAKAIDAPAAATVEGRTRRKGRRRGSAPKHQAPKPPRVRVVRARDFFPVLGWRLLIIDTLGPVILAGIAALIALPYFHLADKTNSTAEIKFFSPPLWSLLIGPAESRIWGSPHAGVRSSLGWPAEMSLLPGFVLYALAFAGLWFSVWKFSRRILLIILLAGSVVLTMGTNFFGGRWTYLPLFGHLPASLDQRIPGRMTLWVTLLLGILAAGAVSEFVRRAEHWSAQRIPPWPAWWLRLATLVPLILVIGEGWNTTAHPVVPAQPASMRTITSPTLVLPTGAVSDGTVMLWSTTRYQKIANGSGGFAAARLAQMRTAVASFPDAASIEYLRGMKVTTVLLVRSAVAGTPWERAGDTPVDSLGITREDTADAVVFHLD